MRAHVDPDGRLRDALRRCQAKVADLTPVFHLFVDSWFKSNRAIFAVGGPGKYVDLSEGYKTQKLARVGFEYPILRAKGRLERSITQKGSPDAIANILNMQTLLLGSKVPYGEFHQFGTKVLPARPWVLLGAEQTAPDQLNRRREAWIAMLERYVGEVLTGEGMETEPGAPPVMND